MTPVRPLHIAIAGAGARAQQHMDTIACLPGHYRIVAVSDTRPERAQAAAARFGATAYANPIEMLDRSQPSALFVVVPPDGHHPLTLAAATRGVHVLCEVPISITLPLADLMIEACARAGVLLEICENAPRRPSERLKQEIIRRGVIGQVLLARLHYTSGSYHGISAVRPLVRGRATRAWGFRRTLPALPGIDFTGLEHDHQEWEFGHFTFADPSGDREVSLLYEQPPRPGGRNTWEIAGTHGRIADHEIHLLHQEPTGRRRERAYPIQYEHPVRAFVETDPPITWENPHAALALPGGQDDVARASQLLTFHRAVTEATPPEYGAHEARTDLELLIALRESARRGSVPIDLPLRSPTGHEQALHDEYRLTYGLDPFASPEDAAVALYPRGGITHGVTHDRIAEIIPPHR